MLELFHSEKKCFDTIGLFLKENREKFIYIYMESGELQVWYPGGNTNLENALQDSDAGRAIRQICEKIGSDCRINCGIPCCYLAYRSFEMFPEGGWEKGYAWREEEPMYILTPSGKQVSSAEYEKIIGNWYIYQRPL